MTKHGGTASAAGPEASNRRHPRGRRKARLGECGGHKSALRPPLPVCHHAVSVVDSVPVTASPSALSGVHVLGWGFSVPGPSPRTAPTSGSRNSAGNSVTELSASTGALVEVILGAKYGFNGPSAISADGTHVWVVNENNSVTELSASTGALIKVISGSKYGFNVPDAVSSDGTRVWVANGDGNSVTELNASTGALVQVISDSSYGFNVPEAVSSTARVSGWRTPAATR